MNVKHEPLLYVREDSRAPHVCPGSLPNHPHNLIPQPGRREGSHLWVCPLEMDAAGEANHRQAEAARAAEGAQKRAAEIAQTIAAGIYSDDAENYPAMTREEMHEALAAAALAGLTEKENAR